MTSKFANTQYTLETVELSFDSADYPNLTASAFLKMTADEGDKWFRSLNTNVVYLAPNDVKPLAWCQIYTINGAPSVREIRHYDAKTDSLFVQFDATMVVPVVADGAAPTTNTHASLETSTSEVLAEAVGAH